MRWVGTVDVCVCVHADGLLAFARVCGSSLRLGWSASSPRSGRRGSGRLLFPWTAGRQVACVDPTHMDAALAGARGGANEIRVGPNKSTVETYCRILATRARRTRVDDIQIYMVGLNGLNPTLFVVQTVPIAMGHTNPLSVMS